MIRWLYALLHLLHEAGAARRDARVRFLKAQVEILRRKLGGNRVIPSPDERLRLLAVGDESLEKQLQWNKTRSADIFDPRRWTRASPRTANVPRSEMHRQRSHSRCPECADTTLS